MSKLRLEMPYVPPRSKLNKYNVKTARIYYGYGMFNWDVGRGRNKRRVTRLYVYLNTMHEVTGLPPEDLLQMLWDYSAQHPDRTSNCNVSDFIAVLQQRYNIPDEAGGEWNIFETSEDADEYLSKVNAQSE